MFYAAAPMSLGLPPDWDARCNDEAADSKAFAQFAVAGLKDNRPYGRRAEDHENTK